MHGIRGSRWPQAVIDGERGDRSDGRFVFRHARSSMRANLHALTQNESYLRLHRNNLTLGLTTANHRHCNGYPVCRSRFVFRHAWHAGRLFLRGPGTNEARREPTPLSYFDLHRAKRSRNCALLCRLLATQSGPLSNPTEAEKGVYDSTPANLPTAFVFRPAQTAQRKASDWVVARVACQNTRKAWLNTTIAGLNTNTGTYERTSIRSHGSFG